MDFPVKYILPFVRRISVYVIMACCGVVLQMGIDSVSYANEDVLPVDFVPDPIAEEVQEGKIVVSTESKIVIPTKKPEPPLKKADFSKVTPNPKPLKECEKIPLSTADIERYSLIFGLQSKGNMKAADSVIAKLEDLRLMGYVLYQRYMHPDAYISDLGELSDWLYFYNDYSVAEKIYKLARTKSSKSTQKDNVLLKKPRKNSYSRGFLEASNERSKVYISSMKRSSSQRAYISSIAQNVRITVDKGSPTKAFRYLNKKENRTALDDTEYDILLSYISFGYLHAGDYDKALSYAKKSADRSGVKAPLAGWVAGLVSWRNEDYKNSAHYFELMAKSPYATGWAISGAAFWASRAHMRSKNVKMVSHWLDVAASYPRTFYGLIAYRSLGKKYNFNWKKPDYNEENSDILKSNPAFCRAEDLIRVGQQKLAEQEILSDGILENSEHGRMLLAYAIRNKIPALQVIIANSVKDKNGKLYDTGLYPIVPWVPDDGFKVDLALVHAIAKQESRFYTSVESSSGAIGLMQIMPSTASYVTGGGDFSGSGSNLLKDPVTNIDIGQKYLYSLLSRDYIDGDLFSLMIAYNAGPGNLYKWKRNLSSVEDPLLFIETIPVAETRAYVERVLANYWIYRMKLGQEVPSLDNVASGRWPKYVSLDNK